MIRLETPFPLDFHWPTQDPFLFCAYHYDRYPKGTGDLAIPPRMRLNREIGMDFQTKDGFRMYHGSTVPGFPVHPHRGFETVTIVRKGIVDHADSLGAAGRYGNGDVQWMTAGAGIQHSEMFPLIHTDQENHTELFQIWLNLPKRNKMAEPYFKMFWSEKIPNLKLDQDRAHVTLISGNWKINGEITKALSPPPASWASQHDVTIAILTLQPGGTITLGGQGPKRSRALYCFSGNGGKINSQSNRHLDGYFAKPGTSTQIECESETTQYLLLESEPIAEPVAQHGPFVMNTRDEIMKAFQDYQSTRFGGWPWNRDDMVHGDQGRFAKYPDGRIELPGDLTD